MVRFELTDVANSVSIKLDIDGNETMDELSEIAMEYWGEGNILFRKGYELIDSNAAIGEVISDGDKIEVVPGPASSQNK